MSAPKIGHFIIGKFRVSYVNQGTEQNLLIFEHLLLLSVNKLYYKCVGCMQHLYWLTTKSHCTEWHFMRKIHSQFYDNIIIEIICFRIRKTMKEIVFRLSHIRHEIWSYVYWFSFKIDAQFAVPINYRKLDILCKNTGSHIRTHSFW